MDASNTPANGRPKPSARGAGKTASGGDVAVRIANRQERLAIDPARLRDAATRVWRGERDGSTAARAEITIAIVDDPTIAQLHERFLGDPAPTDVLTFVMEDTPRKLEADVVVGADTAVSCAAEYGWNAEDELLLYVIHGVLHLVGYDDTSPERMAAMRQAETRHLASFGLKPRYGAEGAHATLEAPPALKEQSPRKKQPLAERSQRPARRDDQGRRERKGRRG